MKEINNPIIKGFNPDPSIIRVEDDYYIATSTFEWYPGVQIHHSKDLVNWRLLTRPLKRKSQLDMLGELSSCGVWAPCLSYYNGTYYLVYTDVKENGTTHNYLVTTKNIEGEWSEPIYLHSRGFDPSLFHDDEGKKWVVCVEIDSVPWNILTDFRSSVFQKIKRGLRLFKQYKKRKKGTPLFRGIILQEYDETQQKLIGPSYKIFNGTKIGATEGPHLYKRNGYYYLLTAEGGTGYRHAVTMARSKEIFGPYEVHPENPILTSRKNKCFLQRAGHADIVETQNGEIYMPHLCSRPLKFKGKGRGRSVLGRETGIQKMKWCDDGWLRLECGGNAPQTKVNIPEFKEVKWEKTPIRDHFDKEKLGIHYQWLRGDYLDEIASLTDRQGYLRLKGKERITSNYKQALIARRQQSFRYRAETAMEFKPKKENQYAGLIVMYNVDAFYYLYKGIDKEKGEFLSIMSNDRGNVNIFEAEEIYLKNSERLYLRAIVNYEELQFYYSYDCKGWHTIGKSLDMTKLADERIKGGFTGSFVGLCCQDPITMNLHGDFDYFDYEELDEK